MIRTALSIARRRYLEIALVACAVPLGWMLYARACSSNPQALQNPDFPKTHIDRIHLDLTSPNHFVTLTWVGPNAEKQETGPFRSSPGAGWGTNDCNDPIESNCPDSHCSPKGLRKVEGFMDSLKESPLHFYVTLIDRQRRIGFHSCPTVERVPASNGCVRLDEHAAQLIHDNSIIDVTEILVDGTWTKPPDAKSRENLASHAASEVNMSATGAK